MQNFSSEESTRYVPFTLQDTSERYILNDDYENIITIHIEAAAKCIPTKPRTKCRIPQESIAVRKK